MTTLSVNINKVATLRNARGGNLPNLLEVAKDLERFGAQGITIHPRPDQRHIRYEDAKNLPQVVTTEFNIEGNPSSKFIDLVLDIKPTQVTFGSRCRGGYYIKCWMGYIGTSRFFKKNYQSI
jgi:pyridoxine 5-phosphate synthase